MSVAIGGQGEGGMGKGGQKVQTSSYKVNKFWGCNIYHSNYSWQYRNTYLEVLRE